MDPQSHEGSPVNDQRPPSLSLVHLLRMKDMMVNQCFDMNIKVNMAKLKEPSETLGADADLSKYEEGIEQARGAYFNKTLALNRMQVWDVIIEKLTQNDDDADAMSLKELVEENADLCEKTMKVFKETRELQDQIMDIQKERLELKVLIRKKMQEINELKQMEESQDEEQKRVMERAKQILKKYRNIATISQNVLRGIIIASRVNWIDDPNLKDIAMGLETIPT